MTTTGEDLPCHGAGLGSALQTTPWWNCSVAEGTVCCWSSDAREWQNSMGCRSSQAVPR